MTQSHIQDTINKYVRKLDRFLGSQLDTRIDNLLKQKPTPTPAPAPESTNKDKFTDTPPTPPISHIIAVSFDELLQTLVFFATFYYITYYIQFSSSHSLFQIPTYLFTATLVLFTPQTLALVLLADYLNIIPLTLKTTLNTATAPTTALKPATLTDNVVYAVQKSVITPVASTLFPSIQFNSYAKTIEAFISTPKFKFLLVRLIALVIIAEIVASSTKPKDPPQN